MIAAAGIAPALVTFLLVAVFALGNGLGFALGVAVMTGRSTGL